MAEEKISVVIPVFNEEKSIPELYYELKLVLDNLEKPYDIIFVDDASTDNSFDLMEDIRARDESVKIIKFRKNFGQSSAILAGFDHADGDVIITMDADLQNDPKDIPKLLEKINEGYDVVSGWRADRKDPLLSKKLPSKLSNWLARKMTGVDIHDFGCTLKAYRSKALKDLELYGEMHRYIPALLARKGFRDAEVKVSHYSRKFGETKYGIVRLFHGFLDLINLKFWSQYSTRPLHFFGVLGILQFFLGFLIGVYLLMLRFLYQRGIADRPLLLLAILLIILGIQFITFGFLSEILVKLYYTERRSYEIEKYLGGKGEEYEA